jgi:hypothetical protein
VVKIILVWRSTIQIHLGFGQKILSVGADQENLLMVNGQVGRFGKVF